MRAAETVYCSKCGNAMPADATYCSRCGAAHIPVTSMAGAAAPVRESGYAGFWFRVIANLVDQVIIALAMGLFFGLRYGFTPPGPHMTDPAIAVFMLIGLKWLYFALLESSEWQATVGKKLLNIRVTTVDGHPLSFMNATGRYFAKYISDATLGIGYIMAGFTERKQALHDMIAGALVVRR